jgi:hypothetical protein
MARENISWGYDRIQGALTNIGYIIAPNTVKEYTGKAWHRTCAGAREAHLLEVVLEGALGCDGCYGLFYS